MNASTLLATAAHAMNEANDHDYANMLVDIAEAAEHKLIDISQCADIGECVGRGELHASDLIHAGNVLSRYCAYLDRKGLSY